MRPIIGVLLRPNKNQDQQDIFSLNKEVADMILRKGGIPLGITPTYMDCFYEKDFYSSSQMREEDWKALKRVLDVCDGFILQGGSEFYDYDVKTIHYLYEKNIPVLGICLGMQAMGFTFNGKVDTLGSLDHKKKDAYVHEVYLRPHSMLASILKKDHFGVNSRHKDFLDTTSLEIVGYSDDGLIEAIEDKNKDFFIGVQWHPESLIAFDETSNLLMEAFMKAVRTKMIF